MNDDRCKFCGHPDAHYSMWVTVIGRQALTRGCPACPKGKCLDTGGKASDEMHRDPV